MLKVCALLAPRADVDALKAVTRWTAQAAKSDSEQLSISVASNAPVGAPTALDLSEMLQVFNRCDHTKVMIQSIEAASSAALAPLPRIIAHREPDFFLASLSGWHRRPRRALSGTRYRYHNVVTGIAGSVEHPQKHDPPGAGNNHLARAASVLQRGIDIDVDIDIQGWKPPAANRNGPNQNALPAVRHQWRWCC